MLQIETRQFNLEVNNTLRYRNAPPSTLSAKTKICEYLGIISSRLAKDLNLIRRIGNKFAHNIHGSSLDSGRIKDLLTNLIMSSRIVEGTENWPIFFHQELGVIF